MKKFALSLAVMILIPSLHAERWGRHGHSETTYDSALGQFHLPAEIGKVMALGSLAPDFFEFDVPAAHAQIKDPEIKGNRLAVTKNGYGDLQEKGFKASLNWHDFYLKAAVSAMQHGQRERSAFLLGYALHNIEDLGTHQGMSNLVHAALDAAEASPDFETKRLALSHSSAALDIAAFRSQIGDENWRLFQGQAVRRSNGQTIVPEPMHTFVHDLDEWDPRSGILPPVVSSDWPQPPQKIAFDTAFWQVASKFGYANTLAGLEVERKHISSIYNFMEGLLPRQEQMLSLLDVSNLEIVRGDDDPKMPSAKSGALIAKYVDDALDFALWAPKRFAALSADDRALLQSTNWLACASSQQQALARRVSGARDKLIMECQSRIAGLSGSIESENETLGWVGWQRVKFREYEANYLAESRIRQGLKLPRVDLRPREEESDSESTASSGSSSSETTRSESGRSSSGINFHSPTYDQLRTGNIRW